MWTQCLGTVTVVSLLQPSPPLPPKPVAADCFASARVQADFPGVKARFVGGRVQNVPVSVQSQGLPDSAVPLDEQLPAAPTTVPPLLEPEPEPAQLSPEEQPVPVTPAVRVDRIVVEGSTVFSPADLDQAVAPFVGQMLTFEDLQAAANAVTQLYLNAGYITSEAVLPPQDIEDGVVQLRVIEGRIDDIQVQGSDRLARYVQRRVALAGTQPVNQIELEKQLQLLQLDPLFANVEASLRQGEAANTSTLRVRVREAPTFSGSLAIDTLSPPSVGDFRTGATLQYLNPLGLGDRLFTSAYRSTTGGANAYELGYQVPLNPMNGTLLLRATPSDYRITDPDQPTFELGLEGATDQYEIQFRQPLIRSLEEEFALSVGFQYRDGSTLLGGLILPATVTSVVEFGQDYLKRDPQGVWGLQSRFRLGTGLFNATSNPAPLADGQFFSWQGQVQRLQLLSPNSQLLVRSTLQLTPDSLLGSEQFFVGGYQSVRGYYQNQRFGDNGINLSVENQFTLLNQIDGQPLLRLLPFIDLGYVWNSRGIPVSSQNFLLGTGLGVEAYPLENLKTRLDFGVPLVTANDLPGDPSSGLRVYFDIRYQF